MRAPYRVAWPLAIRDGRKLVHCAWATRQFMIKKSSDVRPSTIPPHRNRLIAWLYVIGLVSGFRDGMHRWVRRTWRHSHPSAFTPHYVPTLVGYFVGLRSIPH